MAVSGNSSNAYVIFHKVAKLVEDAAGAMRKLLPANPYEEHWVAMLVYHVATICSMIARAANPSLVTASLLIFSSVIAFEAILWVVAAQLWCFIIANVTILLVAVISYYNDIYNLLTTRSQNERTHDSSDTVASEGQVSGDINYGVSVYHISDNEVF